MANSRWLILLIELLVDVFPRIFLKSGATGRRAIIYTEIIKELIHRWFCYFPKVLENKGFLSISASEVIGSAD